MRRSSFQQLALRHLDLLYGAAVRASGNRERAEDLVQETYRIAFQKSHTLRDPAACRAWLLRILHNVHIDEIRRSRRLVVVGDELPELPDPRTLGDPVDSTSARITLERLDVALAALPEDTRWLFWLREIEGLAYTELAEVFDVPVGTIRSRLARLRARLVVELDGPSVVREATAESARVRRARKESPDG
jgi:RNA polymerase sigma-70 factor (ECF subfamily)